MPFENGKEKTGGRKPGSTNVLTRTVKQAVLIAFQELQEDEDTSLVAWGRNNLTDFYKIAAKLIPTEINARVEEVSNKLENYTEEQIDKLIESTGPDTAS